MAMTLPPGTEIEPMEDAVLVRMYESTGVWKEGAKIIKPETARPEVFYGHIEAVGPGHTVDVSPKGDRLRKPPLYRLGDDVLFARFHGEEIEIGDEFFLLLKEDDILARTKMPKGKSKVFFKSWTKAGSEEILADAKVHGDL